MKMFKLILILLCFTSLKSYSQNDTEAVSLLEKISKKYKAYETSKLEVELEIDIPEVEENIVRKGIAWLKGDMFKIDYAEKMLMSNTITHWTFLKDVNELQISNYDPNSMLFTPSKIFDFYSDEYIYRIKEEYKNKKGETIKEIELTPVIKNQEIFKIVATINTSKMEIVKTTMFEKSGFKYAYSILTLLPNLKLSDDFFIFNTKDYDIDIDDITDLR